VHEAVQRAGRLFNRLALFVLAVDVKHIVDEVKRMLVVRHLRVKAGEVEPVGQVVLVNLAKVLVAAGRDKLTTTLAEGPSVVTYVLLVRSVSPSHASSW
jgi:hypothetical protein